MGGNGGVGKTSVMTGLAEWFDENQIPVTLLDLDTENKARGSLTHFTVVPFQKSTFTLRPDSMLSWINWRMARQ
jgi:MinD superfamily P-loop ATPase